MSGSSNFCVLNHFFKRANMKKINWRRHIYWFLTAVFGGLMLVMIYSAIAYEMPGLQDFLGFGGLLFFGCLFLIPFFYLPLMWFYKRLDIPSVGWFRIIALVLLGNIPVYLLLFKMSKSTMSISEAKLFLAGFLAIAIIYGLLYRHKNRENNN